MMRLVWGEVTPEAAIPDFGEEFLQHIQSKNNPQVYAASLTAWNLLANEIKKMGLSLPEVRFEENGKPYFPNFGLFKTDFSLQNSNFSRISDAFSSNSGLYFSISHSGGLAAVMISDFPCGVDVEMIRPEVSEKLYARCMHPEEIRAGMDFFEAWTKKECLAKLSGKGMPGHPSTINTLEYTGWHTEKILDSHDRPYILSAITEKAPKD